MTPRQARFVAEYLKDLNGKQAAIRAGYSEKSAEKTASDLLTYPEVSGAIEAGKREQLRAAGVEAARILTELARLGTVDARAFYDERGQIKPIAQWSEAMGAQVAGIETIIKNAQAGDGETDTVHKIKFWDKNRALDTLAKHLGLLVERVEHNGAIELVWRETEAPTE